MSEIGTAR